MIRILRRKGLRLKNNFFETYIATKKEKKALPTAKMVLSEEGEEEREIEKTRKRKTRVSDDKIDEEELNCYVDGGDSYKRGQ